jgi:hypothetical protein
LAALQELRRAVDVGGRERRVLEGRARAGEELVDVRPGDAGVIPLGDPPEQTVSGGRAAHHRICAATLAPLDVGDPGSGERDGHGEAGVVVDESGVRACPRAAFRPRWTLPAR